MGLWNQSLLTSAPTIKRKEFAAGWQRKLHQSLFLKDLLDNIVHLEHGIFGEELADSEADLSARFGDGRRPADARSDVAAAEVAGVHGRRRKKIPAAPHGICLCAERREHGAMDSVGDGKKL